jgi:hypothetical protein
MVDVDGPLSTSDLKSFLFVVSDPFAHHSITHFEMLPCYNCVDGHVHHFDLEPLLTLKELRILVIPFASICQLDDWWIARAAQAWPCLVYFDVSGDNDAAPQMTFRGMASLLDACPKLNYVGILVDGRSADLTAECRVTYPNIQELCFSRSIIDEPLKIFEYISDVFPNLEKLAARGDEEDKNHPQYMHWEIVMNLWVRRKGGMLKIQGTPSSLPAANHVVHNCPLMLHRGREIAHHGVASTVTAHPKPLQLLDDSAVVLLSI